MHKFIMEKLKAKIVDNSGYVKDSLCAGKKDVKTLLGSTYGIY